MYPCFALYSSIILSPIPAGPVDEPQTLPIEREVEMLLKMPHISNQDGW